VDSGEGFRVDQEEDLGGEFMKRDVTILIINYIKAPHLGGWGVKLW